MTLVWLCHDLRPFIGGKELKTERENSMFRYVSVKKEIAC